MGEYGSNLLHRKDLVKLIPSVVWTRQTNVIVDDRKGIFWGQPRMKLGQKASMKKKINVHLNGNSRQINGSGQEYRELWELTLKTANPKWGITVEKEKHEQMNENAKSNTFVPCSFLTLCYVLIYIYIFFFCTLYVVGLEAYSEQ